MILRRIPETYLVKLTPHYSDSIQNAFDKENELGNIAPQCILSTHQPKLRYSRTH